MHVYLCFLRIDYDNNTNLLHIAILVVIECHFVGYRIMHHIIIHFTGLAGSAKTLNLQNRYDDVYSDIENPVRH